MTKITIEVTGDGHATVSTQKGASDTGSTDTAAAAGALPSVLQMAAATGAINAGPAPTIPGEASTATPIASSVGGSGHASAGIAAGAAPEHVFGN